MNILHVVDDIRLGGGAEYVALNTANSLQGKNFIFYFKKDDNMDESRFSNITFIKSSKNFLFPNLISTVRELRRVIKENQIEIVHSHLFWGNLIARLATPKSKKIFTSIHNIQSRSSLRNQKMRIIERMSYRKDEVTICVSNEVSKDYKKIVPIANTKILYNFIDEKFFNDCPKPIEPKKPGQQFKFIAVGHVKPQKNYEFLIDVFAALKKRGRTNISLDIYGGGELMLQLKKRAEEMGVNIAFKGEVLNLENIYPRYDCFIMASLYEGYGLSIIEAFASGLPALLSDIPVIREVTNSNGIFFNPESVDDCVEKILNFSDNKYNTQELVEREYSWAKRIAQKSTYIDTLLNYYNN